MHYIGETVIIRYNPRDIAEIRVFYQDKYLCTAISRNLGLYSRFKRDCFSTK
ncbi:Mu transposase C-terminal domain-containing protein [Bacillus paranthracis]